MWEQPPFLSFLRVSVTEQCSSISVIFQNVFLSPPHRTFPGHLTRQGHSWLRSAQLCPCMAPFLMHAMIAALRPGALNQPVGFS